MDESQPASLALLANPLFLLIVTAIAGGIVGSVLTAIARKRALFTYFVCHLRVGMSASDATIGHIRVLWNRKEVSHLFLSYIELKNQSLQDFGPVEVRVFSNDSHLLSERTEIVGTTQFPRWTDEFNQMVQDQLAKATALAPYMGHLQSRDYLIPAMNRG